MKNQKVFVMGHKNPDTDSICSAIAYADIKNRTTQTKRYIPRRAGQINEETQYVLNRFGVQPPAYLGNIGTQVKDMDIRPKPDADRTMSLKNAWDMMQNKGIVTLPICNSEDELEGIVTIGNFYEMAGVIPGKVWRTPRLTRFGYITLEQNNTQMTETKFRVLGETDLGHSPAHEFHYFDSENCGTTFHASKPGSSRGWDCIHGTDTMLAGFPHLYYYANPRIPQAFLEKCLEYQEKANK